MELNVVGKFVSGLAIAAASLCPLHAPVQARGSETASAGPSLEGTWVVSIKLVNCETGDQLAPPFVSLLTFAHGGTLTESTSAPAFFPAVREPAHGVWSETGANEYRASMLALITMNGALQKKQIITQRIELNEDGDSFSSAAAIQFRSPANSLLMKGCADAEGKRFE